MHRDIYYLDLASATDFYPSQTYGESVTIHQLEDHQSDAFSLMGNTSKLDSLTLI